MEGSQCIRTDWSPSDGMNGGALRWGIWSVLHGSWSSCMYAVEYASRLFCFFFCFFVSLLSGWAFRFPREAVFLV